MVSPYTVRVKQFPRSDWSCLLHTDHDDQAIRETVPWILMHVLRTKGSAQVLDADGRLVFEAIGDARGESILTVCRYPK